MFCSIQLLMFLMLWQILFHEQSGHLDPRLGGMELQRLRGRGAAAGKHDTWDEFNGIMEAMNTLPRDALWEPSSMEGDPINSYGTSLALELLPYFTKGRIGSMEGLYFESSNTTAMHFLTVAEVSKHPSNPVRGLDYGNVETDFDLGVKHLQMLGVSYLMLWTPEAQAKADANPDLRLVKTIPDRDGLEPKGWKVWAVSDSALVEPLTTQPVVATSVNAGTTSQCFGTPKPQPVPGGDAEPRLGAWECGAAAWWRHGTLLDRPWTASGPKEWKRVEPRSSLPRRARGCPRSRCRRSSRTSTRSRSTCPSQVCPSW